MPVVAKPISTTKAPPTRLIVCRFRTSRNPSAEDAAPRAVNTALGADQEQQRSHEHPPPRGGGQRPAATVAGPGFADSPET